MPVYAISIPVCSVNGATMAMNASCSAPVHVARTLTEPPIWPKLGAGGIVPHRPTRPTPAPKPRPTEMPRPMPEPRPRPTEMRRPTPAPMPPRTHAPPALGDAPPLLHAATSIADTTRAANRANRGVAGCMPLLSGRRRGAPVDLLAEPHVRLPASRMHRARTLSVARVRPLIVAPDAVLAYPPGPSQRVATPSQRALRPARRPESFEPLGEPTGRGILAT